MLTKKTVQFGDIELTVRRAPKLPPEQSNVPPEASNAEVLSRTVEVLQGSAFAADFIKYIFENKEISGGGAIEEIVHGPHSKRLFICFKDMKGWSLSTLYRNGWTGNAILYHPLLYVLCDLQHE